MGAILRKMKMVYYIQEEKGEKKKDVDGTVFPDPSVDEYVMFYHTSWQPGVPEHLYKFKSTL